MKYHFQDEHSMEEEEEDGSDDGFDYTIEEEAADNNIDEDILFMNGQVFQELHNIISHIA